VSTVGTYGSCRFNWQATNGNTGQWTNNFNAPTNNPACPTTSYIDTTTGQCTANPTFPDVSAEEMANRLTAKPIPTGVDWTGQAFKDVKLPVDQVILNPTPGSSPVAQPTLVPQGLPQPVPNSNPQQYQQPLTRITPSPTVADPLRVDVTGETRTGTSATGLTGNETVTSNTTPGAPGEKPPEPDLCEKNPDILACQKLGDPPAEEAMVEKAIPVTMQPDSGWGADNAQCPAARHVTMQGRDIPIPFDLFCQYMSGIRPIVIAMAFLSAAFILVGFKSED
jgi:hypothetical protein